VLIKSASAKSRRGSGKNRFGKSRQKIGKPRQTLKNTKYIHFFQNFKHIKQQQHQINTLAHKYGEITDIYVVTSGCQIKNYTSKSILNVEGPLQYKTTSLI
jgi:hypothetical protein